MRAVVVADGEPHAGDLGHAVTADLLVAADGGATWLVENGLRPHLLVGDLDSVALELVAELEATGTLVERHPTDKEASDAELAVERAFAAGADEVLLLGALGGRLDHELANLLLLADPAWSGRRLRIVRDGTVARAVHGGSQLSLEAEPGALVTLVPVGGDAIGVRTHGLRYPLAGETLTMGRSRGLSNEVVGVPTSVSLQRGTLLVVETAKGVES